MLSYLSEKAVVAQEWYARPVPDEAPSVSYGDIDIYNFFAGLVRDNLTALIEPLPYVGTAGYLQLSNALMNIGNASEAMGYPTVKAVLDEIKAAIPVKEQDCSSEHHERIIQMLPSAQILIVEMLHLVEADAKYMAVA
jgi:hypothetical protein